MTILSLPLLLEAVARATVILASAGLVAAALRRSSASARHLVWVLGLVSALLVPAFSLALPRWEVPLVTIRTAPADQFVATEPSVRGNAVSSHTIGRSARASAIEPAGFNTDIRGAGLQLPAMPLRTTILLIWAAGASLVLGRLLLGLLAVWWMSRRTHELTTGPWLLLARGLAAELGLPNVRFVQSVTGSMPMAWGVLRGSVLMPADADSWPAHRLRVVLLHELAHVRRRDCLTHLVAQIVCAVYWFNPLVWIAARRLRSERERACDDFVLQTGTRGSDYAELLLDIARVMQRQRFPAVLGGASLAMAHRSQLEGRLMAILDPKMPRRRPTRARTAAAGAVFAFLIVSVASVQPWAETRAVVKASTSDAQARSEGPAEPRPDQAAAGVKANPPDENARQTQIQDRVQANVQRHLQGAIAQSVDTVVADTVSAVAGSVAGGVVSGVVGGVVGGVTPGVVADVEAAIEHGASLGAQAMPTPTPTPTPTPMSTPTPSPSHASAKQTADPRAVAALMEALKDSDKEVRETAMHALVQLHDPRMFEPLIAALKDASPDVREQAVFGLGQLRDPRALEPLTTVLHDSNPDVRQQAVFALGQLRDKRAVSPLISALKDENPDVREHAAFALGQIRDGSAVEPLVIALKDSNPDVRAQAAFALGQLHDPRAIDGLTAALKDGNTDVRRQAAFALGQIRY